MRNRKEAPKGAGVTRAGLLGITWPRPSAQALAVIAAFLGGLLYLPTLHYGWVWDDALLSAARGSGGLSAGGFRPLLDWLHLGERWLGAGNPALFHFTNIAFHAAGTWLFCLLALHVGVPAGLAFIAALLFGAHPIHVESVAYISGRGPMVAAVFSMAALLAARTPALLRPEGERSWAIAWAWGFFALATLAHEAAVVTPFLLLGLDRWGPQRIAARRRRGHYAGFFAILLVGVALRLLQPAGQAVPIADRGLPEGHAAAAVLLGAGTLVRLLLWADPLNAMRSLSPAEAGSAANAGMAAAALLAVGAFAWWRRRDAASRVGLLVLALGLIPALPLPGFTAGYASEREAYLPSAGLCLLVASLLAWIAAKGRGPRVVAIAGALAVVGLAGVATDRRLPVWKENIALLEAAAAADPRDPQPSLRLAEHHAARGDAGSALASLDEALARDSTLVEARNRRALLLGTLGRWGDAEAEARRAVGLRPNSAASWATLGDALAQQGKMAEALDASRRAVHLDSTQAAVWYNYGVTLAGTQDFVGAATAYRRALAIDSTLVEAWNNLGALYGGSGRIEDARDAYARAVALAPGSVQARMNLALAYLRLGDKDRAAQERLVLQRLDPAAARRLSEFVQDSDEPAKPVGAAKR